MYIDIGWVQSGDLSMVGEQVWESQADLFVGVGQAYLTVTGGPTGPLQVYGQFSDGSSYYTQSAANVQNATGELVVDPNDFWDYVSVGQTANITTGSTHLQSGILGNPWQFPFSGGAGGLRGGGPGVIREGGAGGSGGSGGNAGTGGANGLAGGDGDDGFGFSGAQTGIFQGVVQIIASN